MFMYKRAIHLISPINADIFNSSISEGVFPHVLKVARTITIYKSKSCKLVLNFRPISVLETPSKILEKLMKKRVVGFLEAENIVSDKQYGFRAGYGTTDPILRGVDECATNLDNKFFTIAVFLDLSKAFDTVNRDILIKKMERLGFRVVVSEWFASYLTDRTMFVDILSNTSTVRQVDIGLPQGSVSSPYLFSLYLNDMSRASSKLKFIHFADDTTVYMSGNNLLNLYSDVNRELDKVCLWLRTNRLSLNVGKTSYMLFTHAAVPPIPNTIQIQGEVLNRAADVKFLGMIINDKLNYNSHVLSLSKKLSAVVGVMSKLYHFVPCAVLRQVYFALFQSVLSYGIAVWGGCGRTTRGRIERVQRRAFKLLDKLPPQLQHPLSFENLYLYNVSCQFHRPLSGDELSNHFQAKINNLLPDHSYQIRFYNSDNILLPSFRKSVSQRQFLFKGIKIWNERPDCVRYLTNKREFKEQMRSWLDSLT